MLLVATPATDNQPPLPAGVVRWKLGSFPDGRGDLTEIFRNEWRLSIAPVQWHLTRNRPNVLRGMHVHTKHSDCLCVIDGAVTVGLHDIRSDAPHDARSATLRLSGDQLELLVIPPGVAHGIYSADQSSYLIAASAYYDPADHRRCRWDCPQLDLSWPCDRPEMSAADRDAPGYDEMVAAYHVAAAALRSHA
jgi:dTDP-4-dehydrorhamnose 3,5-epimerase